MKWNHIVLHRGRVSLARWLELFRCCAVGNLGLRWRRRRRWGWTRATLSPSAELPPRPSALKGVSLWSNAPSILLLFLCRCVFRVPCHSCMLQCAMVRWIELSKLKHMVLCNLIVDDVSTSTLLFLVLENSSKTRAVTAQVNAIIPQWLNSDSDICIFFRTFFRSIDLLSHIEL